MAKFHIATDVIDDDEKVLPTDPYDFDQNSFHGSSHFHTSYFMALEMTIQTMYVRRPFSTARWSQ